MAMTRRHRTDRLTGGFATLTLDPSPRLREARKNRKNRQPVTEAWKAVGQALFRAMMSMQNTFR